MGLEDLFREARPLSLRDVAVALWAEPHSLAEEQALGHSAYEILREMRALHRPRIAVTRIQALWRGYQARKSIQEKKADEISPFLLPMWRHYDEKYQMYVVCQNLLVELKKDDPTWDATQSPYYLWMLEVGGPRIEDAEKFLFARGWVRPENELNVPLLKELLTGVMMHCGFEEKDARAILSVVATFKTH
jgi:hypothetical protein